MSETPRSDALIAAWRPSQEDLAEGQLGEVYSALGAAERERARLRTVLKALRDIIIEDDGEDNECWSPHYRAIMDAAKEALRPLPSENS